jgi:hypothetical protein
MTKLAKNGLPVGKRANNGKNLTGRPKGVKNKSTLLREAMAQGFDVMVKRDFKKVVSAVMTKAIEGDLQAAKLILDRIVPVSKAVDSESVKKKGDGLSVTINIGSLEDSIQIVNEDEPDMTIISEQ